MNIKEAAEQYEKSDNIFRKTYIKNVTHYLEYMKSQGYAMMKVGGDVDDIYNNALELGQKAAMTNMEQGAMIDAVTKVWMDALKQALTIGEERGRRFAEWASRKDWKCVNGLKMWSRKNSNYTQDDFHKDNAANMYENKTTSQLWEIAEREGIFNDKNGKP